MYWHFVQTHFESPRSDQIVKNLVGSMWIYKQKCDGKFSFTGKEFRQQFKSILEQVTLNEDYLTMDGYDDGIHIPDNFADLMLVKQLAMVDAIETPPNTDDSDLLDYLTKFYQFQNAMQDFEKIQLITPERQKQIDKEAIDKYRTLFRTHQDSIIQKDRGGVPLDEDEQKRQGRATLNAVMDTTLNVTRLRIDRGFSNGWYLSLSNEDKPRVAWHYSFYKQFIKPKK